MTGLFTRQSDGTWLDRDRVIGGPLVFDEHLVPSHGALWGAVANAFSLLPGWPNQGPAAHRYFEEQTNRKVGIYSSYYRNDALFPSTNEIGLATEAGSQRVLYLHWRVAYDTTWDQVPLGNLDARIDAEINYLKANFADRKFFISIHSEPESYVDTTPGSGQEPSDFAAMYRYVRDRFESAGVTNAIWVVAFMGYARWATEPWYTDLYPGDAHVDWVAWDPYSSTGGQYSDFGQMLNQTYGALNGNYQGFYNTFTPMWNKPFMLSEYGIGHQETGVKSRKAAFYQSQLAQQESYPRIKAMVKFDTLGDEYGGLGNITVFDDASNQAAFVALSASPYLLNIPDSEMGA